MEEEDRFSRSIPPFGIVHPQTRREVDRSELHVVRLVHRVPPFRPAFLGGSYAPRMMPSGHLQRIYRRQFTEARTSLCHLAHKDTPFGGCPLSCSVSTLLP